MKIKEPEYYFDYIIQGSIGWSENPDSLGSFNGYAILLHVKKKAEHWWQNDKVIWCDLLK